MPEDLPEPLCLDEPLPAGEARRPRVDADDRLGRQPMPATGTPGIDDPPTPLGRHATAETVRPLALDHARLKGTFHAVYPGWRLCKSVTWRERARAIQPPNATEGAADVSTTTKCAVVVAD